MKLFIVCVFAVIGLSSGEDLKCREGEYVFSTNCGPLVFEPTCYTPHSKTIDMKLCDYHVCFCKPPTVRETSTDTCVTRDKCPTTDFQQFFKEHPELHPELQKKER